jgi:hypothetical protein
MRGKPEHSQNQPPSVIYQGRNKSIKNAVNLLLLLDIFNILQPNKKQYTTLNAAILLTIFYLYSQYQYFIFSHLNQITAMLAG